MNLSPRLQCVANKIKSNSFAADIGTDHAYIPIYIVRKGICKRAIATDVRTGPLKIAEANVRHYGLLDKIMLRKGYGLSPVNRGEVDCAVLAGMGGHLVCDILEKDKETAQSIEYFIIQPIQAPEAVREYLYKNRYSIYDEILVKENSKIYQIMCVKHGVDSIDDDIYFEIGKRLIQNKDPLLEEFIASGTKKLENAINKIGNENTINAARSLSEYKNKLERYREVLRCL